MSLRLMADRSVGTENRHDAVSRRDSFDKEWVRECPEYLLLMMSLRFPGACRDWREAWGMKWMWRLGGRRTVPCGCVSPRCVDSRRAATRHGRVDGHGIVRPTLGGAPIIVITAFGDLATAIDAINKGAFEYVVKPFDVAEIRAVIERALRVEPTRSQLHRTTH